MDSKLKANAKVILCCSTSRRSLPSSRLRKARQEPEDRAKLARGFKTTQVWPISFIICPINCVCPNIQSYLAVPNQSLKLVEQPLIKVIMDFQLNGRIQAKPQLLTFWQNTSPPDLSKEYFSFCSLKRILLIFSQNKMFPFLSKKYFSCSRITQRIYQKQSNPKSLPYQTKRKHIQKQQYVNLKVSQCRKAKIKISLFWQEN